MNKYEIFDMLNNIDDGYISDTQKARETSGRKIFGKKSTAIIAACAAVILCGSAAAAAGLGGMDKISGFFMGRSDRLSAYEQLPALVNPADYATALENETHPLPGTAAFVSASCSEHFLYTIIEYAPSEEVLSEIPHGAELTFDNKKSYSNLSGTTIGVYPVSFDGEHVTVAYYEGGISSLPENMEITLSCLGYRDVNSGFTEIEPVDINMTLKKSEVAVIPPVTALNTSYFDGIEFTAEISPLGVLLSCDSEAWEQKYGKDTETRHSKEISLNYMKFYLKDGSSVGDGVSYDSVYGIFSSEGGWIDGSRKYFCYGFENPIDVSEIDRLTLRELDFDF